MRKKYIDLVVSTYLFCYFELMNLQNSNTPHSPIPNLYRYRFLTKDGTKGGQRPPPQFPYTHIYYLTIELYNKIKI